MGLFKVYNRFDITLSDADGVYVYDDKGTRYLDLYGGHGVISIGHGHPDQVEKLKAVLDKIMFYSNSINMPLQTELAERLARLSGYKKHQLFLCNSGAEANENAIKVASFHTGRKKLIAFTHSFHGRTAAALNVTNNPKLSAPVNNGNFPVQFLELNDLEAVQTALAANDVAAVIVEGIQGVGGLDMPTSSFLQGLSRCCKEHGTLLILDEIQSGAGRSGRFFAHQDAEIEADIISMAKGMGNGFPVAGILIAPSIQSTYGMLGTTFGGSYLAATAAISVLEVLEKEALMAHVNQLSPKIVEAFEQIPQVKKVKGKGLMLGIEFDFPVKELRKKLLFDHQIFTGSSANPNLLRILPPLGIRYKEIEPLFHALKAELAAVSV